MSCCASLLLFGRHGFAQVVQTDSSISGAVTSAAGSVMVPGVTVTLTAEPSGVQTALAVSDSQGRFQFAGLPPGTYRLRATFAGFDDIERGGLTLAGNQNLVVSLDTTLTVSTRVDVVGRAVEAPAGTIKGRMIDIAPVKGGDLQSMLPMLPGVIRGPDGRINMKGGRPTQTGFQVGQAYASDPTTGNPGFNLPVDAVESIEVLPNPYAAEHGRFSAGMTQVETRRGTDRWDATANNFIPAPCLKLCDGKNFGIRSYDPRLIVGGPVIRDWLWLSQSLQYHDHKDRIPSLPPPEDDTLIRSLDTFTRLDANLGAHQLSGTVSFFPENLTFVNLNTFNPQPVTPDFRQRGYSAGITATHRLSDTALFETTVNIRQYNVSITAQGSAAMQITPAGNRGNFFNRQERRTSTVQGSESFTVVRRWGGDHVIKTGVDVLRVSFTGTSESLPVDVRREDGARSQRIDFSGPSVQYLQATDVGAFVQDRWRVSDRLLVELGARIDRDGVIGSTNVSPRFGLNVGVLPEGRGVLRGGAGLFRERTPLLVGAFEMLETRTVSRFADDGVTPLARPVAFVNQANDGLRPPAARVWNLEYNQRITPTILVRINHLERAGTNEFLIEPVELATAGVLRLDSSGRARYRETEFTVRHDGHADRELSVSYVRSRSESDQNAFDAFFGNFRNPIIRPNQYSFTSTDTPNRLMMLGVFPAGKWLVSPLVELRNGFPYSIVDRDQDFVGLPNAGGRFPFFYSLDLNINRAMVIRGRNVRVGLKANHILNNATPRDVQANTAAPAFGTFYNSLVRRFGLTIEIQP